jgi:hypothetical protein
MLIRIKAKPEYVLQELAQHGRRRRHAAFDVSGEQQLAANCPRSMSQTHIWIRRPLLATEARHPIG